jgi:hypothetical protein
LVKNGFRRNKSQNFDQSFTPKYYIETFKRIKRGFSGLEEMEILKTNSPKELVQKSRPNLLKFVARMDTADWMEYPRQMDDLIALFAEIHNLIEQKKAAVRFGK